MVNDAESSSLGRQELIKLSRAMLDGKMNLIEGVRRICALRILIVDKDNEVFLPFRAIESETDTFPLGNVRASFSAEYLKRSDSAMESYAADARDDILNACRDVIAKFT